MIVGVGCDIVDHITSKELNWATDSAIQSRIFTKSELEIYNNNRDIKFLSGRFAAKESVLKCLGTGMQDGIALTDIQILQNTGGSPTISLSGVAQEIAANLGINYWHISISHSNICSCAFVTAEKR